MTRVSRPDLDPRIGTVLRGKYRLDRVIGTGGMAVVYKATHRNNAEFAVKMLYPELSVLEDIRSRFLREGYAANAVKHPGAVLVVDDDVAEDGAAFLVMELLDGVPCEQFWGSVGNRVSVEVASAITIQLLDVLAAAHEKGIIHRDIKPANLFLTRPGIVKVLDFGIAKAREAIAGAHATGSGITLGTPAYMAPELARGRAREIDGRTDLWAAAATFFALVSGELVHVAETKNEFVIAAGTKPARSLAEAAPGLSPALVEVIDRGLAFEKADRWPSAGAMRDALALAHRASFGTDDVEGVVARGVSAHVPSLGSQHTVISPVAVTSTTPSLSARVPTERLSTSAGTATAGEPEVARASAPKWALAALIALCAATLGGTAWLRERRAVQQGREGAQGAAAGAPSGVAGGGLDADVGAGPVARLGANAKKAEADSRTEGAPGELPHAGASAAAADDARVSISQAITSRTRRAGLPFGGPVRRAMPARRR